MTLSQDFINKPGRATIEEVLRGYLDQDADWWWMLVAETEGEFLICTFGSLLPYLVGKTPHIVHSIGDCALCTAMEPLFWTETGRLVEKVLADQKVSSRLVSELPMAELPVVDDPQQEFEIMQTMMMQKASACGVRTGGVLSGVYILQTKGDLSEPPQF